MTWNVSAQMWMAKNIKFHLNTDAQNHTRRFRFKKKLSSDVVTIELQWRVQMLIITTMTSNEHRILTNLRCSESHRNLHPSLHHYHLNSAHQYLLELWVAFRLSLVCEDERCFVWIGLNGKNSGSQTNICPWNVFPLSSHGVISPFRTMINWF